MPDIAAGFNIGAPVPVDNRMTRKTITERDSIPEGVRYEGLEVYCEDTKVKYRLEGGVTNDCWVDKETDVEKKKHTHDNKEELDKIKTNDVSKWNAKTGLAIKMRGKTNGYTVESNDETINGGAFDTITVEVGDAFIATGTVHLWSGIITANIGDLLVSIGTNASTYENWMVLSGRDAVKAIERILPDFEKTRNKNVANGYAGLDENSLVPKELLPDLGIDEIETLVTKNELFDTETIIIDAVGASANLLNPNEAVVGVRITGWSTNTNKWGTNTTTANNSHVVIPVIAGHKYKTIPHPDSGISPYSGVTFFFASGTEANLDVLTWISTSTGSYSYPGELYKENPAYAEAPDGATYLIYNNNSVNNMVYDYTEWQKKQEENPEENQQKFPDWVEYREVTPETTEELHKIKEELLPNLGIDELAKKVIDNEARIAEVENAKADAEVWEDVMCEWAGGKGYNYDGTLYTPQSDDEYTWGYPMRTYMSYTPQEKPIEVNEGEVWKTQLSMALLIKSNATGENIVTLAPVVILDENDNVVYTQPSVSGVQIFEFEVPAGGKKMFLTYRNSQPFMLQKKVVKSMSDYAIKDLEAKKAQLKADMEARYRLYRRNRPTLQQNDKAYVIFVVDDLKACVSTYADMFIERGLPLCLAVPPQNLKQAAANGTESRKQVAQRVVNAGGEVLTHHGSALSVANFNFDEAYNSFVVSKEWLEKEGFEVNGTILVGGQTAEDIEALRPEMEKWTSYLYEYSDRCGVAEPYYHARVGMYPAYLPFEKYKEKLATAIENKELIVFYWHDADNISDADLVQYLDYFKTLPSDDVEAVTYKTYYDKVLYNG